MDIVNYLHKGAEKAITRKQLCYLTGLDDRKVREAISQARRNVPIINLQNGDGYFIPDLTKESEIEYLRQYVKQEESRAKSIFWSLKPARKMLKEVEK